MNTKITASNIIHVDGDAFFASCEIAQNERLRGTCVVTGEEKGIATAISYAAKKRGVTRGMTMRDIKKICPEAICIPSQYDVYKIYSKRMYAIVKRHAGTVEEYSVDECFGDISSAAHSWDELVEKAHAIKNDLERDLGMTFSLGLAPTKTLAKVASSWNKPSGFTAMQAADIPAFLKKVPIGKVWGIGPSTSFFFQKIGITTALEFSLKNEAWIQEHCAKPYQIIWHELNGRSLDVVTEDRREEPKSLRATRTFRPPSKNKFYILSELAKNAEKACLKLRRHELQSRSLYFFLKTQTFRYVGHEITFDTPTSVPSEIMTAIEKNIDIVFDPDNEYRSTGIVLHGISPASVYQADLFNIRSHTDNRRSVYTSIDALFKKFGRNSVFIASSLFARRKDKPAGKRHEENFNELCIKIGIPYWGEAS